MRWLIVSTIRKIEVIQNLDKRQERKKLFEKSVTEIEGHRISMIKQIESHIRNQLITADMSTSLIADSGYCHSACNNLIQMAKTLFIKKININPEDGEYIIFEK